MKPPQRAEGCSSNMEEDIMSTYFAQPGGVSRVMTNQVTVEQEAEARDRLGARIGKYLSNRRAGMGHHLALAEAVKP